MIYETEMLWCWTGSYKVHTTRARKALVKMFDSKAHLSNSIMRSPSYALQYYITTSRTAAFIASVLDVGMNLYLNPGTAEEPLHDLDIWYD